MLPILTAVLCLTVQISSACFSPGKTWSLQEIEILHVVIGVPSVYQCQKECFQYSFGDCLFFTWTSEEDSYPQVCFLFESVPVITMDCSTCISGPVSCPTCSQPYACENNSTTIIEVFATSFEIECQTRCDEQDGCEFYTWYNKSNPISGNQCFLLTSCTSAGPCQDCSTGPKVCPGIYDGGVLLMGGFVNGRLTGNVELIGDCNAAIQDLPVQFRDAAAAIKDESVFYCGGRNSASTYSNHCYIRENTGGWTQGPSMNKDRGYFTLNTVGSKLVAVGGSNGAFLDTVEVLESSVWEVAGFRLNPRRDSHCAVTISDSSVLLVGGYNGNNLKTTEELDINSGTVTPYANLPYALDMHSCTLYNLNVLVSGGFGGDSTSVYSLDYRSKGSHWVLLNHLEHGRFLHTMHLVKGALTVYGGEGAESTLEQLNGSTWVSQPMKNTRTKHSSVVFC